MTAPPIRKMWQRLTDAIGGIGAMVVLVPTLLPLLAGRRGSVGGLCGAGEIGTA
jgi:hypothetical protein